MRRYLYYDICTGQINRCVSHFRKKDRVNLICVLEVIEDAHSFDVAHLSRNERLLQLLGIHFQSKDVIREDDDLVPTALMKVDKILASKELIGIVDVERLLGTRLRL